MDNDKSPDILTHGPEWCVWRALRTLHLVTKHKVMSEPKPAEKHVFSHHSQYFPPCFPPQQKNMTLVWTGCPPPSSFGGRRGSALVFMRRRRLGGGCLLTWSVLVCLQTCQAAAVPGAAEEAGAFRTRQHKTHHTELAEKGPDAHQGIQKQNTATWQR